MKEKNQDKTTELMQRFTELEQKLIDVLNMPSVDIDEKVTKATLKKNLSKYIKHVEEAKVLLEEYESVAKEIEKLTSKKADGETLSKAVVDLREEEKIEEFADAYATEIVVVDEKVTANKRKKKTKTSTKEL